MKTDLPEKLRAWRTRYRLSQRDAAMRLGIPKASLENWEQGRTTPRGAALLYVTQIIATSPRHRRHHPA
jgi:DNA-binding transcriptional regulator YiaG